MHAPSTGELAAISADLGLDLDESALEEFAAAAQGPIENVYRPLAAIGDPPLEPARRNPGRPPTAAENARNAWAWRCEIEGVSAGPLAGRSVGIKDCISIAGMPMRMGSSLFEGFEPDRDATVVERILAAGGRIIGTTVATAFCFDAGGLTCEPGPQPENPHDRARLPGGSSSGSGVAVAGGEVDLALGTDTGGSVRIPASWCGCIGLKPTYGLVPYTGSAPAEISHDHIGLFARDTKDCATMLEALAGPDGEDPRASFTPGYVPFRADSIRGGVEGLRIGLLDEGFGLPGASEPDVDELVAAAARRLEQAGAEVIEVSVPEHRQALFAWSAISFEGTLGLLLRGAGYGTNWRGRYDERLMGRMAAVVRDRAAELPDTVKYVLLVASYVNRHAHLVNYGKAQNLALRIRAAYGEALRDVDALVLPTTPMKARLRPIQPSLSEYLDAALGNLANVVPYNLTGSPAMSIPCGISDGLPVGMMIVGRWFDEEVVLRIARAHEEMAG